MQHSRMSIATDMLAAYQKAEMDVLSGKEVVFEGRRQTMEDLPAIRAGRQEWEQRVRAEQSAGGRLGGLGSYGVVRYGR